MDTGPEFILAEAGARDDILKKGILLMFFRKLLIALGLASSITGAAMAADTPAKYQTTTPSGLQYTDVTVGTGPSPKAGQTVTVTYVGTLENGKEFDASAKHGDGTFSFTIGEGQVIKGWDEGVMGMKVGGERMLKIPPQLGYGAAGAGGAIPPNATLLFDIHLLDVK
jgi:peptidylprolyl isomerase